LATSDDREFRSMLQKVETASQVVSRDSAAGVDAYDERC